MWVHDEAITQNVYLSCYGLYQAINYERQVFKGAGRGSSGPDLAHILYSSDVRKKFSIAAQ
jgi:hypothetical protein